MSRQFLVAIDLAKNELQNAAVHNLAAAPSSPVKGQLYMNTTDNTLYWWDGTQWVAAKDAGGSGFPGYAPGGATVAETAFGQAKADGVATTVARGDHTHGSPTHDNAAHSAINLSALAPPTSTVSMNSQRLTGLAPPTASTDAANKQYVDDLIQGLAWKDSVEMASTANVALSGTQTIDGVSAGVGDRVLLKNQTAPAENGIWVVASGAWTRATDADSSADLLAAAVFVESGTTNADTAWVMTTNAPITVGTTGLTWVQFASSSGGVPTTRTLTAGNGLTGGGDLSVDRTFDVATANGSIVVGANDIQVGYAGTGGAFGSAVTAARSDHSHNVTYPKFTSHDCTAGTSTVINHIFNTRDIIVQVVRNSTPWDQVECDVECTSTSQVTVRFASSVAAAAFRILITGIQV